MIFIMIILFNTRFDHSYIIHCIEGRNDQSSSIKLIHHACSLMKLTVTQSNRLVNLIRHR